MKSPFGTVMQLGYVVADVKTEMRHWLTTFKTGPFICIDAVSLAGGEHRGVPVDGAIKVGFSYFGTTQIEIIQPLDDAATVYREFLNAGSTGLHHIGFWSDAFDEAFESLTAAGYKLAARMQIGTLPRPNYYFDPPDNRAPLVELCYGTPQKRRLYAALRALADDWDGADPIRHYPSMDDFARSHGVPTWSDTGPNATA